MFGLPQRWILAHSTALLSFRRTLSNGSVRWEYGYNFQQDVVNEMTLDGETLWVSTAAEVSRQST